MEKAIKAISIHQPYPFLITQGIKTFETRTWFTNYRGPLLICSAKTDEKRPVFENLKDILKLEVNWEDLPRGYVIAIADLVSCVQMNDPMIDDQSCKELLCGNWEPGNYAWKLENVRPFSQLIPVTGKQGLWNVPDFSHANCCS